MQPWSREPRFRPQFHAANPHTDHKSLVLENPTGHAAYSSERQEILLQERMGQSDQSLTIYHCIIKYLCGWMQHNDCVIMHIIAFPLVLGHIGRQAWHDSNTALFVCSFIACTCKWMWKENAMQLLYYNEKTSVPRWPILQAVRSSQNETWRCESWCCGVKLVWELHRALRGRAWEGNRIEPMG